MNFKIIKYDSTKKIEWDDFVENSKNGTFLFKRDYMDYHSDRFIDSSILIYNRNNLVSIFPSVVDRDKISSHAGLTYGGLITNFKIDVIIVLEILKLIVDYYKNIGIRQILYKPVPYIYHKTLADEDLYSLFRLGFNLVSRNVSTTVNLKDYQILSKRKNGYNKCLKSGIRFEETEDFSSFFSIVNNRLIKKYEVKAVHSEIEMQMLYTKFNNNIKLFGAFIDDTMIGGALLYLNNKTIHAQYLAASEEGRKWRVLDFINISIILKFENEFNYYDLGTSNENSGYYLNESLISQKVEFGGHAICYDTYKLEII